MKKTTISLEFFPPKTDEARANFREVVREFAALDPAFMTVTYGAGGSTRAWTAQAAAEIQSETGIPTAAHLTCVNTTKAGIRDIAREHWENGIRHIIALRGDVPKVDAPLNYSDTSYYHYANELVTGLREQYDFEISVAAYPEKHPDAPDMKTDIAKLKRKCETGVTRAITQFFFNNDVYFRFVDKAADAGVDVPIIPGVLPISDFSRLLRFAQSCGASVPKRLHDRFTGLSPEDSIKVASEVLAVQCQELVARGAEHIHFYTLNRADLTKRACRDTLIAV